MEILEARTHKTVETDKININGTEITDKRTNY